MEPSPGQLNLLQGSMQSRKWSRGDWRTAQMEGGNAKESVNWTLPSNSRIAGHPFSPMDLQGALSSPGTLLGAVRNFTTVFLPRSIFFWKQELQLRNKGKWLAPGWGGEWVKEEMQLWNPVWTSRYLFCKKQSSQLREMVGPAVEGVVVTDSKPGDRKSVV